MSEVITIGRATNNLPSTLDDSEVEDAPSGSGGSAATSAGAGAGSGSSGAKVADTENGGASQPASAATNGKTWLDWLFWR